MGVDFLMKKHILFFLATLVFCPLQSIASVASNQIIVVANVDELTTDLTREQVRNLFMGASIGRNLEPITLPPHNRTRSLFNAKVIGMAEQRIQSYWAQMKFTGRLSQPKEVTSEQEMVKYIVQHKGSIGYLTADTELPEGLSVLFSSE